MRQTARSSGEAVAWGPGQLASAGRRGGRRAIAHVERRNQAVGHLEEPKRPPRVLRAINTHVLATRGGPFDRRRALNVAPLPFTATVAEPFVLSFGRVGPHCLELGRSDALVLRHLRLRAEEVRIRHNGSRPRGLGACVELGLAPLIACPRAVAPTKQNTSEPRLRARRATVATGASCTSGEAHRMRITTPWRLPAVESASTPCRLTERAELQPRDLTRDLRPPPNQTLRGKHDPPDRSSTRG